MLKLFFVLILSSFTYGSLGADNTDVPVEESSNLIDELLEGVDEEDINSLLYSAVQSSSIDNVRDIVERFPQLLDNMNPEQHPFLLACWQEDMDIMEFLLDKKPEIINDVDVDGDTCLLMLILFGAYEGLNQNIKNLIDRGASVTIANDNGLTPYLGACKEGNIEIIEHLLDEKEVDVNSVNEIDGTTCLHQLAAGQHEDHIRTLMSRGADHKITDKSGRLPAHVLIQARSNQSELEQQALNLLLMQALSQEE